MRSQRLSNRLDYENPNYEKRNYDSADYSSDEISDAREKDKIRLSCMQKHHISMLRIESLPEAAGVSLNRDQDLERIWHLQEEIQDQTSRAKINHEINIIRGWKASIMVPADLDSKALIDYTRDLEALLQKIEALMEQMDAADEYHDDTDLRPAKRVRKKPRKGRKASPSNHNHTEIRSNEATLAKQRWLEDGDDDDNDVLIKRKLIAPEPANPNSNHESMPTAVDEWGHNEDFYYHLLEQILTNPVSKKSRSFHKGLRRAVEELTEEQIAEAQAALGDLSRELSLASYAAGRAERRGVQ